jgi:hypothetical protein
MDNASYHSTLEGKCPNSLIYWFVENISHQVVFTTTGKKIKQDAIPTLFLNGPSSKFHLKTHNKKTSGNRASPSPFDLLT